MGFLSWLKEKRRDKTRDRLCAGLCAMGYDAHMVELGRQEEDLGVGKKGKSLGMIEIPSSPIRYVNVVRNEEQTFQGPTNIIYSNIYLIPDPNVYTDQHLECVGVKNRPILGKVVDIRWEGEARGGLIEHMNQDSLVNRTLVKYKDTVSVTSRSEYKCWAMLSSSSKPSRVGLEHRQSVPSSELWDCYERIARHLLESSGK